jgi:hypothetical protein
MTLEKYFSQVTVVEKSTGLKEAVVTKEILVRDTKVTPKIACLWLIREPAPRLGCPHEKSGFCTYEKYCSMKGVWERSL